MSQQSPQPRDQPERWFDHCDWWADPRLAFAAGMAFGYDLGSRDGDRADDQQHRAAVRHIIRHLDQSDARAAVDRGDHKEGSRAA